MRGNLSYYMASSVRGKMNQILHCDWLPGERREGGGGVEDRAILLGQDYALGPEREINQTSQEWY